MISGIDTLEPTAVSRVHPAPPLYGRGGFLIGDPEQRQRHSGSVPLRGENGNATDATGLSVQPDKLAAALEGLAREQAASAPERAYAAAGRSGWAHARNEAVFATLMATATPGAGEGARLADAQAMRGAPDSREIRTEHFEPGQTAPAARTRDANGARTAQAAGSVEARSAERTFAGSAEASPESGSRAEQDAASSSGSAASRKGEAAAGRDPAQSLTEEEKLAVRELKARDAEVRAHEQAHIGASGGLSSGGATFQHERGPDGRMYAVAGEVQIDTSKESDPDATIAKAQKIRSAALAPAQPSGQDRQVAAQAAQMEAAARQEKASGEGEASSADEAESTRGQSGLMVRAGQAYERASGRQLPAPWGSGISFAV